MLAVAPQPGMAADKGYVPSGTCGGFPRLDITTPAGWCVALIADASQGLRFPRRILEVAPNRYWIVDMGSWEPRRGRLLEMRLDPRLPPMAQMEMKVLLQGLDRPLGLARGPDGKVYVGEAGRIWRTAVDGPLVQETVVDNLPSDGAHPLKEFVFGASGQLFINVGSLTDACRDAAGAQAVPCAEVSGDKPRAAVYRATLGGPHGALLSFAPFATGLRNSVALAYEPLRGRVLQGENSIDYTDAGAPAEELNVLQEGRDYGWPYCVGDRVPARGYEKQYDCKRTEPPHMPWPAHVAPLQMHVVPAASKSPWAGQLLVAWHGHRSTGHRVVSYALDKQGLPAGKPIEWLGGWDAKAGVRPQGAPTGLTVDSTGRLWVVEDRNKTVMVVLPDKP